MASGVEWRPHISNWPGLPVSLKQSRAYVPKEKVIVDDLVYTTASLSLAKFCGGRLDQATQLTLLPCVCGRGADCSPCHGRPRMQHTTHTPGFSALHPPSVVRNFRECRLLKYLLPTNISRHSHLPTSFQGRCPEA